MSAVPEGWEERVSKSSGKTYYLNLLTKESQWEMPSEPAKGFPDGQVQVCRKRRCYGTVFVYVS